MNDIILLILSWLPLIPETALGIVLVVAIKKALKDHFTLPFKLLEVNEKLSKENNDLKKDNADLKKDLIIIKEMLTSVSEDVDRIELKQKGFALNEKIKKD